MGSIKTSFKVSVKNCSLCPGTTEYFCHDCRADLCQQCKETHVVDLDTKHHAVTIYREKFINLLKLGNCATHPDQVYEMYCEPCDLPVCFHCRRHRKHKLQNARSAYENKRKQNKDVILKIRSEILYNARMLKSVVIKDKTRCPQKLDHLYPAMSTKSNNLKKMIDAVLAPNSKYQKYLLPCVVKLDKIKRYLHMIQQYELKFEQTANRPIQFLKFIKKTCLIKILDASNRTQHFLLSPSQEVNINGLIKILSKTQIKEGGKRQAGNDCLMTLMSEPKLEKHFPLKDIDGDILYMSCVTPEQFLVSDTNKLTLTNLAGDKLYVAEDSLDDSYSGLHTVNSECEMIYIDKGFNINKISNDRNTTSTFIKKPDSPLKPQCVFWSSYTGDLLVGMSRSDNTFLEEQNPETRTYTGEVRRYNKNGQLTQIIPSDNTPKKMYSDPHYITENNNGDVVVSDCHALNSGAVVVTESGGRHRFSYTKILNPGAICTDALSHILVARRYVCEIQILNENGEYLSTVLTFQNCGPLTEWIHRDAFSLNYDRTTHLLWISWRNKSVSVFRHLNRHLADYP